MIGSKVKVFTKNLPKYSKYNCFEDRIVVQMKNGKQITLPPKHFIILPDKITLYANETKN